MGYHRWSPCRMPPHTTQSLAVSAGAFAADFAATGDSSPAQFSRSSWHGNAKVIAMTRVTSELHKTRNSYLNHQRHLHGEKFVSTSLLGAGWGQSQALPRRHRMFGTADSEKYCIICNIAWMGHLRLHRGLLGPSSLKKASHAAASPRVQDLQSLGKHRVEQVDHLVRSAPGMAR